MTVRPSLSFLIALLLTACVSLSTAQVHPDRIRVSAGVETGLLLSKVDPVYPPLARQARIQGTVVLHVQISKTGDIEGLQLVSGHPMLAPAAMAAVKQWKYRPYLLNGEPIKVDTQVQVNFVLADKPPVIGAITSNTPTTAPDPLTLFGQDHPPSQRVVVDSYVMRGFLINKIDPVYPRSAREQGIQGLILLNVYIDKQGNVYAIKLINGPPALSDAAVQAVKHWKYKPYLLDGTPTEVDTRVEVSFTLTN